LTSLPETEKPILEKEYAIRKYKGDHNSGNAKKTLLEPVSSDSRASFSTAY
jgi:hypothetical protein